jgi:hypothetical protein
MVRDFYKSHEDLIFILTVLLVTVIFVLILKV